MAQMKINIEQRAKEYSLKDFDGYYTGKEKTMEEAYIAGATEQREIDMLRAFRWFLLNADKFNKYSSKTPPRKEFFDFMRVNENDEDYERKF